MDWMLYLLLALALVGDVLLAVLLAQSRRRQPRPPRRRTLCRP